MDTSRCTGGNESHPYRAVDPVIGCETCDGPAILRCPRCNRPFCEQHAYLASCCPNCELELSRKAGWYRILALGLYSQVSLMIMWYIGMGNIYIGATNIGVALLGAGLIGLTGNWIARRGVRAHWGLIEQAELKIAPPSAHAGSPRRMLSGSRGNDMYADAYNAGWGRVQGCAG